MTGGYDINYLLFSIIGHCLNNLFIPPSALLWSLEFGNWLSFILLQNEESLPMGNVSRHIKGADQHYCRSFPFPDKSFRERVHFFSFSVSSNSFFLH